MEENQMAKVLRIIAGIVLVVGIIGSLILGDVLETTTYVAYTTIHHYNTPVAIGGVVSSIIFSVLLFSLAEIISLLQSNYDKNSEISNKIDTIKNNVEEIKKNTSGSKYSSSIDEIEANLPEI